MNAIDPADAIQLGIYALLAGDTTLTSPVGGVYDGVPEDVALPYVALGEMSSLPDGTHDGEGRQTLVVLHTWTEAQSNAPGNTIGARLVALLWHRHRELGAHVTGHKVWRVEHEFAQTLVDPQPGIRHRIDHFRVWTSEEA